MVQILLQSSVAPPSSKFLDQIKNANKKILFWQAKEVHYQTQITAAASTYILDVSESVEGKRSNYKLLQESGVLKRIEDLKLYLDLSHQGINSDFPEINAVIPRNKLQSRSNKIFIFNRKRLVSF